MHVGSKWGKDVMPAKRWRNCRRGRFEVEFEIRRGDRVAYGGGLEIVYQLSQTIMLHTK